MPSKDIVLGWYYGIPSHDTSGWVFVLFDPEQLEAGLADRLGGSPRL